MFVLGCWSRVAYFLVFALSYEPELSFSDGKPPSEDDPNACPQEDMQYFILDHFPCFIFFTCYWIVIFCWHANPLMNFLE